MSDTPRSVVGLTFPMALTLLFIGLKLTGYIAWSWWWVLAPMLISWGIGLCLLAIVALLAFIAVLMG